MRLTRCAALLGASVLVAGGMIAPSVAHGDERQAASALSWLSSASLPPGTTQAGAPFGGVSGIDFDSKSGSILAVSDDTDRASARFYEIPIDLQRDAFRSPTLSVKAVTALKDATGGAISGGSVQPEAIRLNGAGGIVWAGEPGDNAAAPPPVRRAARDGRESGSFSLPAGFNPQVIDGHVVTGVRGDMSVESVAVSPDRKTLTIGLEAALAQDGPAASLNAASPARIIRYDQESGRVIGSYVYEVDELHAAPTAALPAPDNEYLASQGLSELLAVNATDYLAVERSFSSGVGYSVKVYWTSTLGAQDVQAVDALTGGEPRMPKHLLFDSAASGLDAGNVEGLSWGPNLSNGDRSLLLATDDEFGARAGSTVVHLLRVSRTAFPLNSVDVNSDGKLNAKDLGRLLLSSAGDLNGDGKRNASDVLLWHRFSTIVKAPAARDVVNLQMLSINDLHGTLEVPTGGNSTLGAGLDPSAQPVGGVEYLAGTLNELRRGAGPSLTVAAGDMIGGSPLLSGMFHDEPTIESMETFGLDVSSVGNHEFDEGVDELLRIQNGGCHPVDGCYDMDQPYDGAGFPFLAANVIDKATGSPLLAPTWVKEIEGVKVGFIGMTLEGTRELTSSGVRADVEFLDEVATANSAAAELHRQGVRAIIVLLHEGGRQTGTYSQCQGMSGPVVQISQQLDPRIDMVITGHTHQPYVCHIPDPKGSDRVVTSASSLGRVVTEARIPIDRRTRDVMRNDVEAMNHLVTRTVAKDTRQTELIGRWNALAAPVGNRVVGSITADIRRSETRDSESSLVNLVADAYLAATQSPDEAAEISFMMPGGIRADMVYADVAAGEAPGEITYAEAFAVKPFTGSLITISMTGAQIEKVLEEQFNNSGSRAPTLILGVSEGFSFAYSASAPVGDKIDPQSITLNGAVLDSAATYRVSTNTFLAGGGDGFLTFAEGTERTGGSDDFAAITDYLAANSPVPPPGTDRIIELP